MSSRAQAIRQYNDVYDKLQKLMNTYNNEIKNLPPESKEFAEYNKKVLSPQIKELARKRPKESAFLKDEQSNLLKLAKSISEFQSPIAGMLNSIESKEAKGLGKKRNKLKKEFSSIAKELDESATTLIQNSNSDDTSGLVSDYYDAAIESQEVSKLMSVVAEDIVKIQGNNVNKKSLKERIVGGFDIIAEKIEKIAENISDKFELWGKDIKDNLDKIKQGTLKKAKDIADIFKKFAQKLSDMTAKIIEKIFGIVSWMNTIAKTKGFGIETISLTLPPATVKMQNLLVLVVPVVEIQTPEVTFTFKPDDNDTPPKKKSSKIYKISESDLISFKITPK
ncbi:MAG: hypothetical protein OER82_08685 [Nitrosopumilus sp.]|nr:hypothetical protein [Nitrosopumilus sp.]